MLPRLPLAFEIINFLLETIDIFLGLLNGGPAAGLPVPSLDFLLLLANAPLLGVNLLADSALIADFDGLHDEPHAAGLASAVLLGAMLAEMAPLIVAAGHSVLVVETHCDECESLASVSLVPD
jgi:hypothetical protein